MNETTKSLYEASAEDMLFGIGVIQPPQCASAPCIQVFYRDWSRPKLEIVRESFVDGLTLNVSESSDGKCDIFIATRQTVVLQKAENGHTSALRGPAWNAHLPDIDKDVISTFETDRQRFGGYLLFVQTPQWEFMAAVDDASDSIFVASVVRQSNPKSATGQ